MLKIVVCEHCHVLWLWSLQSPVYACHWRAAVPWLHQSNEEKNGSCWATDVGAMLTCVWWLPWTEAALKDSTTVEQKQILLLVTAAGQNTE